MRFFRFRFINTLLFFLCGILLGFIIKERFHPGIKTVSQQRYQPDYAGGPAAEPEQAQQIVVQDDDAVAEDVPPVNYDEAPRGIKPAGERAAAAEREDSEEVSLEPDSGSPAVPEPKAAAVLAAAPDQFFKKPAVYSGREIEMSLQLITAKSSDAGLRLNFVHVGPERKLDYLYVDDAGTLGEKPDLRVGYFYQVRFLCRKGDPAEGNTLSSMKATGEKANWATGLSAIE